MCHCVTSNDCLVMWEVLTLIIITDLLWSTYTYQTTCLTLNVYFVLFKLVNFNLWNFIFSAPGHDL